MGILEGFQFGIGFFLAAFLIAALLTLPLAAWMRSVLVEAFNRANNQIMIDLEKRFGDLRKKYPVEGVDDSEGMH